MTGEIGKDPFKPSLTSHDRPADKIGWTKYRSVKVPFATIRVSGRDLQWQLGNSPFYTIESWRAHSLVACADNVISLNQKVGDTITTGISKTSTDTFKASATVTVSAEAGIQIPGVGGAKASTSVAVTLGYEHSTGVAVTLGYEHSTSVTVLQRQRRVAEAMQRHLLPHLPNVPGLQMTARYLPDPHAWQVGGDWYDAFTLPGRHHRPGPVATARRRPRPAAAGPLLPPAPGTGPPHRQRGRRRAPRPPHPLGRFFPIIGSLVWSCR
ncbi:hypothetical protein SAMN06272789_7092 [Streptomyces sp. 1331.2]|nr:hypothetical protein SAMN06272789_7092 [Streptomyces sp. 1331.2]